MPSTNMIFNYRIYSFLQICYFEKVLAHTKLYQFAVQAKVD